VRLLASQNATKAMQRTLDRRTRLMHLLVGSSFAGMAAEAEYVRRFRAGAVREVWAWFGTADADWDKAYDMAQRLFPTYSSDLRVGKAMAKYFKDERTKIEAKTREPEYWGKISALAEALLVHPTIPARKARATIRAATPLV
jgi:hypothetical protein